MKVKLYFSLFKPDAKERLFGGRSLIEMEQKELKNHDLKMMMLNFGFIFRVANCPIIHHNSLCFLLIIASLQYFHCFINQQKNKQGYRWSDLS